MPDQLRLSDLYLAAARAVAAEVPLPAGWPAKGRAWPVRSLGTVRLSQKVLGPAGWPTVTVTVDVPQYEHRGPNAGQRTGDAPQEAVCVPEPWLRALAGRMRLRWAEVCRGTIRDE